MDRLVSIFGTEVLRTYQIPKLASHLMKVPVSITPDRGEVTGIFSINAHSQQEVINVDDARERIHLLRLSFAPVP